MLGRLAFAILCGIIAAFVAAILIFSIPNAAGFEWAIGVIGVLVAIIVYVSRPTPHL